MLLEMGSEEVGKRVGERGGVAGGRFGVVGGGWVRL